MNIQFYSYGACKEVTGSKHFLKINKDLIQFDCGMFQGRRESSYQKNQSLPFAPAEVSAVLLSHAHFDHSGALPIAVNNGFSGNIYSTPATRDITNIILMDSAYIQQKDFEYLSEKIKRYPDRQLKSFQPLYNAFDAIKTMQQFVTINYQREFYPLPGVKACFYDAGHILGSSLIYLDIEKKVKFGFSGDLGRKNLPILRDPGKMPDLDFLVVEGTYGNRLHKTIGMGKAELSEIINSTVKKGGKIIIPAFTIERTQELIYIIHILLKENKIPAIPIFIDSPMAVNATSIFKIHPECYDQEIFDIFLEENIDPFGFENIKYVRSVKESIEINSKKGPAIIISASGMAENGRILHHLKNNIENPNNTIAIVGFMAEHTLGRKLVDRFNKVKIFGKTHKVKADVKTLNAFSAHADYQEIKEWILQYDLDKLKKVFLVHGEEAALTHLQGVLLSIGLREVEIVEYGNRYAISN